VSLTWSKERHELRAHYIVTNTHSLTYLGDEEEEEKVGAGGHKGGATTLVSRVRVEEE